MQDSGGEGASTRSTISCFANTTSQGGGVFGVVTQQPGGDAIQHDGLKIDNPPHSSEYIQQYVRTWYWSSSTGTTKNLPLEKENDSAITGGV